MNRIYAVIFFAFLSLLPMSAQTGIGKLTHIANASAAASSDAASALEGEWKLVGIVGGKKAANEIAAASLAVSGFSRDSTEVIFAPGSAFAITCGDSVIPGTWSDNGGNVRIGFSKIFTYAISGRTVSRDGSLEVLFRKDDFLGFLQRTLAIIGRRDTRALVEGFASSDAEEMGFKLKRK